MKKLLISTMLLACSIGSASAATTTWAPDLSVGINNLEINGVFYNVTASTSTAIPSILPPREFGYDAVDAIASFINGSGRSIYLSAFTNARFYVYSVSALHYVYPDDRGAPVTIVETGASCRPCGSATSSSLLSNNNTRPPNLTLSSWTPVSSVPIPTAAFMFAPALLSFIGLRRKKLTLI